MDSYNPPYTITEKMLELVSDIKEVNRNESGKGNIYRRLL